jgi:hypothetical protein
VTLRRLAVLAALLLPLQACAGKGSAGMPRTLEGPPLALAGEQGGKAASGQMERECMLGQGQMTLRLDGFVCAGIIKSPPNASGHVAAVLRCEGGGALMFTLRPLGPDQGLGIGRQLSADGKIYGEPLIFYFHPWDEEARRRLDREKPVILEIINKREQK